VRCCPRCGAPRSPIFGSNLCARCDVKAMRAHEDDIDVLQPGAGWAVKYCAAIALGWTASKSATAAGVTVGIVAERERDLPWFREMVEQARAALIRRRLARQQKAAEKKRRGRMRVFRPGASAHS
jgi:hypothetical protein